MLNSADQQLLNLGHIIIYKVISASNTTYLGWQQQEKATIIKCFSLEDFSRRKADLLKAPFVHYGKNEAIESYLEQQADRREELEKNNFAYSDKMPIPMLWDDLAQNQSQTIKEFKNLFNQDRAIAEKKASSRSPRACCGFCMTITP